MLIRPELIDRGNLLARYIIYSFRCEACYTLAIMRRTILTALLALTMLAASRAAWAQIQSGILHVGGAEIDVSFEAGNLSLSRGVTLDWISESACAVSEYYGHFPVQHLRVIVVPLDHGKGVVFGRTFVPGPVPVIRAMIGTCRVGRRPARGLDHDA